MNMCVCACTNADIATDMCKRDVARKMKTFHSHFQDTLAATAAAPSYHPIVPRRDNYGCVTSV